KRPVLAGVLVGAAITIKLYPVILLGYFLWERNVRVIVASLLATVAFYFVLPALVEGGAMAWFLIRSQAYVLSTFGSHWPMDSISFQNIPASAMRIAKLLNVNSDPMGKISLVC